MKRTTDYQVGHANASLPVTGQLPSPLHDTTSPMQAAENLKFVTPTAHLLPPWSRALFGYGARDCMRFWARPVPPDQPRMEGGGL